jgi:hypothetical protein
MAEIRRLQRIASGRPTRADSARKAKGILYLVIILAIIICAWTWKRSHQARTGASPVESIISFEVFNAAFGPRSPMDPELKKRELESYLGKRVVWTGKAVYVNREGESTAYMNVRHLNEQPAAGCGRLFRSGPAGPTPGGPIGRNGPVRRTNPGIRRKERLRRPQGRRSDRERAAAGQQNPVKNRVRPADRINGE